MVSPLSNTQSESRFSVRHAIKLGTFHIGSSMGDLLTSAIWNRILITDLGIVAWPVALLSALRYLLAPLSLWAGHRSDTRPILGSRRLAYIWLGRLLMCLSLPLLPLSTVAIARNPASLGGWGLALISFLLYGVGTLISGAPFLALLHDNAPYERRGQMISIVQIMLVVSFAFIPAIYAMLMPTYEPALFTRLVLIGMAGAAAFWLFSVWGEERRVVTVEVSESAPSFLVALTDIWSDVHTRRYALFLAASAFFTFMQDAVLEPFGGDVFGLPAGETTRFNAYWGIGVLVAMVGTVIATRHRRPEQQVNTTAWGLAMLGISLLLLGAVSLLETLTWVTPVLIVFGLGLGVFTVGGISLLMAMSTEEQAGRYLALWSVIQLIARGAGIAVGGIIRDVALMFSGQHSTAYATVFILEALGILAAIALLHWADVSGFAQRHAQTSPLEALTLTIE